MEKNELQNKVLYAAKWSSITELMAKLVSPITNMILARILAPEVFGVIATVTMITSFADMFTDSGFQKYLVQQEFEDEQQKNRNANVAFWTHFGISMLLWSVITVYREQLAILVGNPGLGKVIAVACLQLPLTSFSSIQMALYRRNFDFRTLFLVRIVSVCIPFIVTIPMALFGLGYWALIVGTLAIQLSNACILTLQSTWKPSFYYSADVLKKMLPFSIWSLIEAISIWLTSWVDAFIIGSVLTQHYLGLYKTSTVMVNTLMGVVTSSIMPVLFSTLSRLQRDDERFKRTFLSFQKIASILVFPLGVGIYLFSDLATDMLLGEQWREASGVIGVWALTSSIMIVFGHFCSEVYRSKGRPRLSVLAQVLHLIVLVPACIVSSKFGFWPLVYTRSWIRMQFVLVHLLIMKKVIGIPIRETIQNVSTAGISAVIMGVFGYIIYPLYDQVAWRITSIILCAIFYLLILSLFPSVRQEISGIIAKLNLRTIGRERT